MNILTFESLPSTNQYCELLDLENVEEFTIFLAHQQTSGIGQRGNRWESQAGKNLTFSLILKPAFLAFEEQYKLTKVLALGVSDYLQRQLPQYSVAIKWPNDLYVDGRKIAGILTSNHIQKNHIASSICGIGFNVNQTYFSPEIPNPTSLALLSQKEYNINQVLSEMLEGIKEWYERLKNQEWAMIDNHYHQRLYRLGQWANYRYQEHTITAKIIDVNRFGHLQLECLDGETISCDLKQIVFL